MTMQLWILRPIDTESAPWVPWYDKSFGFVVRAVNEHEARMIAADDSGDEKHQNGGTSPWLDAALSSCDTLEADGEAGLVMRDFYAA